MLGCAMWMDDPELIEVLSSMANACIVVRKQQRARFTRPDTVRILELAESVGLAQEAFPELSELAASPTGAPRVVGPGTPDWLEESMISGVREVGFRSVGRRMVPIVHAKIVLLGEMCWTDEHPSGHVVDQLSFRPVRLWVGSANFTTASRLGLEMGFWSSDESLLRAARAFLLNLIAMSEPLGCGPDVPTPEFLPVTYDDEAFREYLEDCWSGEDAPGSGLHDLG